MTIKKYVIVIESAKKNFSAFSPDILGCVATGSSVAETIQQMKSAIQCHLEGETVIPESKGLSWYKQNKRFEEVSENHFITTVNITLKNVA